VAAVTDEAAVAGEAELLLDVLKPTEAALLESDRSRDLAHSVDRDPGAGRRILAAAIEDLRGEGGELHVKEVGDPGRRAQALFRPGRTLYDVGG
jgi:hypothetical protein